MQQKMLLYGFVYRDKDPDEAIIVFIRGNIAEWRNTLINERYLPEYADADTVRDFVKAATPDDVGKLFEKLAEDPYCQVLRCDSVIDRYGKDITIRRDEINSEILNKPHLQHAVQNYLKRQNLSRREMRYLYLDQK